MIDERIFDEENVVLDNVFEIEELLCMLKNIDKESEHLQGLKKFRTEAINKELDKLSFRSEKLRGIILNTMKKHEPSQKTIKFPSVGKVTRKKTSDAWEIEDENKVIAYFDALGKKSEIIETKEVLNKKQAKIFIESIVQQNKTVDGTKLREGSESLSIAFDKEEEQPVYKKSEKKTPEAETAKPSTSFKGINV